MKKVMLFILVAASLANSAFAHNAQPQPAPIKKQTVNASEMKKVFTDGTLIGSNGTGSSVWIQATNTSTSQTYYLTVSSTYPMNNTDHITLPVGTYNILVSMSQYCSFYLSDDDDAENASGYYYTFNNITINSSYATVLDVQ